MEEWRTENASKPGMLQFKCGLSATIQHYFEDLAPGTELGTDLNLQLTIAPKRPVSFSLLESFNRTDRPFSDPANAPGAVGVQASPDTDWAHYTELAGARLTTQ